MGAWDVERGVLVAMLLLIVGGLGFIWYQRSEAETLQRSLGNAERQLSQIGGLAEEILTLQDEMAADILARGQVNAYEYIERQMVESRIGKTSFQIGAPRSDRHDADGYEDTTFLLTPAQAAAVQGRGDFTRAEIANFLLYIEGNTTRMKVTGIRLDRSTRAGAGEDAWQPRLTITDRHPTAGG
jgi:hypothetical protein